MIRKLTFLVTAAVLAACVGCGPQREIDPQADLALRAMDPQADLALRAMSETLSAADHFTFHGIGIMEEPAKTGQLVETMRDFDLVVSRPGRLAATIRGDDVQRKLWYDGKALTVLDETDKVYTVLPVPDTIDKTVDFLVEEYGLTMPLADLLFGKPYDVLVAGVQTGTYVGLHSVDDHSCHHLSFRQEVIDWEIWIDASDMAVPRKLVITYKLEDGQPQYTATMGKWDLAAKLAASTFSPQLTADAKKIDADEFFGVNEEEGE